MNISDDAFAAPLNALIERVDRRAKAEFSIPRIFIDCCPEINEMSKLGNTTWKTLEQPGVFAQLFGKRDLKVRKRKRGILPPVFLSLPVLRKVLCELVD